MPIGETTMTTANTVHTDHEHRDGCGHVSFPHGDHTDYAHDGHIDRERGGSWESCEVTGHSEADGAHEHRHGAGCGHVAVPHGDHVDYLHDGSRHAAHENHYDEH
jgi:hypothetical protein